MEERYEYQKATPMDYGKSGAMSLVKNTPRHRGKKVVTPAKPPTGRATQEELLARMKAAAEAKKKG